MILIIALVELNVKSLINLQKIRIIYRNCRIIIIRYPREIIDSVNKMDENKFLKLIEIDYNFAFLTYYCKRLSVQHQKTIINIVTHNFEKYNKNH